MPHLSKHLPNILFIFNSESPNHPPPATAVEVSAKNEPHYNAAALTRPRLPLNHLQTTGASGASNDAMHKSASRIEQD
ncbi:hypothetical protein PMIN01_09760 [Paraphaeosphaeria minitans]|uniref:Uncharacterized protein n=1 Tax=Paraphaeosphaeria minitans TaxID=565426 RepID=A0A9P6KML4_9PLEO|nr:hypothetical protein PMIN01_09760 [Paraphaeosphaeria minitans]